jgi:uncharacterized repeat protein (TIGR01451 family)/fimbrial isopeptide formation D2 family protein
LFILIFFSGLKQICRLSNIALSRSTIIAFFAVILLTSSSTVFAYPVNQCAGDRFGSDLVCTAGDVSITGIATAPGSPTKCTGGSTYTVDLDITVNFSTPDRWDVGIFLSEDGNDPQILTTNGGASSCSTSVLPLTSPFLDLDSNGGTDTCGDGNGAINGGAGSGVLRMSNVPVACLATPLSNGNLFIPFVVSWDNQSSPSGATCTSIADPVPNTKSKCNAPDGTVAAEVQYGTIETIVLPDITKDDGVSTVVAGDSTSYTVVITNTTGADLDGAIFKDPAVTGLTIDSLDCAASGGATCPASLSIGVMQGGGIQLPLMPNGSALTFTIDATVDPATTAGTITNTAYVTFRGETNEASDTNNVNTKLVGSKAFTSASINTGETSVLSVTLTNTNLGASSNLGFNDVYPAGLVNAATPSVTNTCGGTATATAGGNLLALSGASLAAGASCTVSVNVTSTAAGAYLNSTGPITSNEYTGDAATANLAVGVSSLETSTKSVVDLNGGEADPGDTLRYTITITETAGRPATGVTVTDVVPATLSAPTVTTCPAGATCSVAGQTLTATNVTVPANSSVTLVFDTTIPLGTAPATAINNCADISNPTGIGTTTCASTTTVSPSQVAITGNKWLYLDSTTTLSRTPPSGTPSAVTINDGASHTWSLSPTLAQDVTISPLVTPLAIIPVNLYLTSDTPDEERIVEVTVACSGGGTTYSQELIFDGTALNNPYLSDTTPDYVLFNNLPFSAEQTCAAGDTWTLTVANNSTGKTAGAIDVYPVSGSDISYFSLPSLNVINIDSVDSYDAAYPAVTTPAGGTYSAGDTVYVRAIVSDPFGSYDISSATVTITDPDGVDMVIDQDMGAPLVTTSSSKTFEYSYTLPAGATSGSWTTNVTGHEGTEGTVFDDGTGGFIVSANFPLLSFLKISSITWDPVNGVTNPVAIPGANVEYTLRVTNAGTGVAEDIVFTDPIPANTKLLVTGTPVVFTDGSPTSGYVQADVSVTYSSTADCADYSYDPVPTADVNGFNTDVCNMRITMNGAKTLPGSNAAFDLTFTVRIE